METSPKEFKIGQVWKYNTRPEEDDSTLTILKIENYEQGDVIIHIRVDRINLYNPNVASGPWNFIGHLPFSNDALAKSVTTFERNNVILPDFSEGYNQWKQAWDNSKAGYWKIELKHAIEAIDNVIREKNKG